ncbi:hypothetical protein CKN99_16540 [Carnobacterium maltaromaticum]|uniref:hypothetical protein n=1 Tax=Carnobacterium TaxID=2747 RepID=UPI0005587A05|nr:MULTISPECIES: hypothetical protein [Carnobacterium]MBR3002088.1 hypothetical protein [Clostridia bacterium]KRN87197.1 hypothetical protein IV75_GL000385 [Carnobacterium maltaromaticum]MDT1946611.1 hypothetical protein [Carnobacterium maltaromaticum]MDT2001036.1 hypothetical protein [Carnobacterium maltaromaticum]TFJ28379.1 hypothetical protein CKN98_16490 [Carnobacterium maltaromaticum]
MIANYPFLSLTCFFILLCYISLILYKIKVKMFYKKNSYRKIKLKDHPLYLIYPFEKKIYVFIWILYILWIILATGGLFLIFSNSGSNNNLVKLGIIFQVLATFTSFILVANYFRFLKKTKSAINKWSISNPSEEKKFVVFPSNIVIYKKVGYISFLLTEIFFIVSIITEYLNIVY